MSGLYGAAQRSSLLATRKPCSSLSYPSASPQLILSKENYTCYQELVTRSQIYTHEIEDSSSFYILFRMKVRTYHGG